MRRNLIQADLLECVLGLGPNLFYNSPMEACILVCRTRKPASRRGQVLFIDALQDVARQRAVSYLKPEHQKRILNAYRAFKNVDGFATVATTDEILARDGNLSIPRYVSRDTAATGSVGEKDLKAAWKVLVSDGEKFWTEMDMLAIELDALMDRADDDV